MKAWVLHGINDFRLKTVEKPIISSDEVLVSVKAAGICGSDIPRIYQTGAHTHPMIPGHEFSGVVEQCGENVDKNLLGSRVGIFPLIPCRNCLPCKNKQYEMCRNYSYLGSRRDGGFAQYVAVPVENIIKLPDNVTFEEAAMLEPMAVATHAMRRIKPLITDTVAVCGLGTIGLLLVMFLKEAGIENIFVIGNKDFQEQTVLKLGIAEDNYCDSKDYDSKSCDSKTESVHKWLMERTDNSGVDVFFECVGKNDTLIQAIDCTAPAGRICLVGNPYSDMNIDKSVYWKILRNQLTVMGTWNSSFTNDQDDDWHYVLERLEKKKIEPAKLISHKFKLEDMEQGLHIMRDKTEDYIKIMSVIQSQ